MVVAEPATFIITKFYNYDMQFALHDNIGKNK